MFSPSILHKPPPGFHIRAATLADVPDLTRLWYCSFNSSHKFWSIVTPENEATSKWFDETWTIGIEAGPEVLRTWVVEDLSKDGHLVAFARWSVPHIAGVQDIPLPPYPAIWDAELTRALWDGMPLNRVAVMGNRSHWMLEFLGVDNAYQQKGLGFSLVDWGCRQADAAGLEVYLDATIQGLPFYKRHFNFQSRKRLSIPCRPDSFGMYELTAVVRPVKALAPEVVDEKSLAMESAVEIVEVI